MSLLPTSRLGVETLRQIVDPRHTAAVIIDMQNDDCRPDGKWARLGETSMIAAMLPTLSALVRAGRVNGVPMIWLKNVWRKGQGFKSLSPAYLRFLFFRCHFGPEDKPVEEGSWGAEIIEDLDVRPDDIVIQKTRSSGFLGTELDLVLRSNGIRSLVVTGVATHACVQSTVMDAICHDYYVVVAEDCVAAFQRDLHEAAMTTYRSLCDVCAAQEIIAIWSRGIRCSHDGALTGA